jgi:NAD(P)-dependent dehydrogenase (short-subunit alcohol dehydrogenase family)
LTVVTGAASGIGRATALRLARAGHLVVAADVDRASLEELADGQDGISSAHADVADERSVERLVAFACEQGRLTGLVNVAGIGSTTTAPNTPTDVWDRVMAVNARGTFLCCKHAVSPMERAGGGSIVNVASIAGLVGLRGRAAYCASKGAVIALTRALAVDHVGQGIRANAICPGTIDSPWVRRLVLDAGESIDELRARQPMGRLGTPEEVAHAVEFLLDASFATGTVLALDGGLTAA